MCWSRDLQEDMKTVDKSKKRLSTARLDMDSVRSRYTHRYNNASFTIWKQGCSPTKRLYLEPMLLTVL